MKLRNKVALTFVLLSSGLLFAICSFFYFLNARNVRQDFLRRLHERAEIAASAYLEKDELSQRIYDELIAKHFKTLPEEREFFVRIDGAEDKPPTLPPNLTDNFLRTVETEHQAELYQRGKAAVGIRYVDNQGTYLVLVTATDKAGTEALQDLRFVLLVISLLYIVAVALVSFWFARDTLEPITRVIEKMEEINTSNLHLRLAVKRRSQDELSRLVQTFNSMLDRLETSIEAQHQFISNASHELKTPLTSILGELEWAQNDKSKTETELRQSLKNIEEEANRIQKIILHLLHLAQTFGNEPEKFFSETRIDELLMDVLEQLHALDPKRRFQLELDALPADPKLLVIRANRPLLKIALTNIVENAYKFSGNQSVTVIPKVDDQTVSITIIDRGQGIEKADIPYIFEPFFRAETARHLPGYGIGLPIVQKIVRLHEGSIEVDSTPPEGTTFTIRLPR